MRQPPLLLHLLLLAPLSCLGEVFEGHLFSIDSWTYLARFAFVEDPSAQPESAIEYNITYEKGAKLSLAAYYGGFAGWDKVYDSGLRCNERLNADYVSMRMLLWENPKKGSLPYNCRDGNAELKCTYAADHSNVSSQYACPQGSESAARERSLGLEDAKMDAQEVIIKHCGKDNDFSRKVCEDASYQYDEFSNQLKHSATCATMAHSKHPFQTLQTRWFFLALANCNPDCDPSTNGTSFCSGPVRVSYRIVFTNGETKFTRHFPADEIGIFEIDILFFMLQTCMLFLALIVRSELMSVGKYHHTVKILTFSVAAQWLAIVLDLAYCDRFANDGMRKHWQFLRT